MRGVEASLALPSSLTKLRSVFVAAVRSCWMLQPNTVAFKSLFAGLAGGDPGFHVVRSRFQMTGRLSTW